MEDCVVDADVDVRDPDEKSIMTYVAQFLQYSRDFPAMEEESQVSMEPGRTFTPGIYVDQGSAAFNSKRSVLAHFLLIKT